MNENKNVALNKAIEALRGENMVNIYTYYKEEKTMKPITYKNEDVSVVKFISKDNICYMGEYIDMRIERNSVPKNKYVYECRHGDDGDWVTPSTIEDRVYVNFAGTFITDKPIVFPNPDDHYILLREKL